MLKLHSKKIDVPQNNPYLRERQTPHIFPSIVFQVFALTFAILPTSDFRTTKAWTPLTLSHCKKYLDNCTDEISLWYFIKKMCYYDLRERKRENFLFLIIWYTQPLCPELYIQPFADINPRNGCYMVNRALLKHRQSHKSDVSYLIAQTSQQTAAPRWSGSSLIFQLFSCRGHGRSEFWIKHYCSVMLTLAVKHILMKLEMQKIFFDRVHEENSQKCREFGVNGSCRERDRGDVENWTLWFWQEEANFISNLCCKHNFPTINSF